MPLVDADASVLRQVFVNPLSNAFKFTRGRTRVVIDIGCRVFDGKVAYQVRDNARARVPASSSAPSSAFTRRRSSRAAVSD